MDLLTIIFLSGGLFLGWSLGANDAANVFGTAVGTRMVRFKTAAIVITGISNLKSFDFRWSETGGIKSEKIQMFDHLQYPLNKLPC